MLVYKVDGHADLMLKYVLNTCVLITLLKMLIGSLIWRVTSRIDFCLLASNSQLTTNRPVLSLEGFGCPHWKLMPFCRTL